MSTTSNIIVHEPTQNIHLVGKSSDNNKIIPAANDGVFKNIPTKLGLQQLAYNDNPPSYIDATSDTSPSYWQTTVFTSRNTDNLILVDGLSVGSLFIFLWNLLGEFYNSN